MFDIKEELKKLPEKSGVYIMKDKSDSILYIGKAISLKNRVRQYFMKTNKRREFSEDSSKLVTEAGQGASSRNKPSRIQKMVSLIDHFEYIVTDNELEALILECNLIKKNMPKFNVLLKDSKTYPYIKIDVKSEFPNVFMTRSKRNDGSKYFGPYANAGAAKEMLAFIKERFKTRACKNFKSNKRACLNYHIEKCSGPCVGHITKEEYREQIDEIIAILDGKIQKIIKRLDEEIKGLAEKQEYEKAADLRDKKMAIVQISEKQKVSNINENSIDVIGICKNDFMACIEIFFVRNSKMCR